MGKDEESDKFAAGDEDAIRPIDIGASHPAGKKPVDMSLSDEMLLSPAMQREQEEEARRRAARDHQVKQAFEGDINYIHRGEYVDLIEKVPILKRITIGVGWQKRLVEGETLDVDISIFLLNKAGQTREDEDFVFYNNVKACDGAVHHMGDSRSGAGDGDDESVFIDLTGLPFDIMKIMLVFSLYDPEFKGHHFGMIRKMYLRIGNRDDNTEIVRYALDDEDKKGGNVIMAGALIREGPRWVFEAMADISNGGLAKIATDYGIIVKELQSTGEEKLGDDVRMDF